jgi:hypothetical protein
MRTVLRTPCWLAAAVITLLAACSTPIDPARKVEAYLTARANRDESTVRRLLCAELEPQADQEISTFEGVSGVKMEGMSCRRDGDTDRVICAGKIVADYGAEQNEFPLGAYRIKQEDGEWKWCGETN